MGLYYILMNTEVPYKLVAILQMASIKKKRATLRI